MPCVFSLWCSIVCVFFFFKQKTAYEMRMSDWSSDGCSSDLDPAVRQDPAPRPDPATQDEIAEAGMIAAVDPESATPMRSAGDRLHDAAVDLVIGVAVAMPLPCVRGADRVHDLFLQALAQQIEREPGRERVCEYR